MGNVLVGQFPRQFSNVSATGSLVTAQMQQLLLVCAGLSVCGAQGSAQLHLQLSPAPEGPHV